jgi:hypothetical protein
MASEAKKHLHQRMTWNKCNAGSLGIDDVPVPKQDPVIGAPDYFPLGLADSRGLWENRIAQWDTLRNRTSIFPQSISIAKRFCYWRNWNISRPWLSHVSFEGHHWSIQILICPKAHKNRAAPNTCGTKTRWFDDFPLAFRRRSPPGCLWFTPANTSYTYHVTSVYHAWWI